MTKQMDWGGYEPPESFWYEVIAIFDSRSEAWEYLITHEDTPGLKLDSYDWLHGERHVVSVFLPDRYEDWHRTDRINQVLMDNMCAWKEEEARRAG